MRAPLALSSAFIAIAITVIGYFTASLTSLDQNAIAIGLFVGAFISPLLVKFINTSKSDSTPAVMTDVKTLYVGNLPYRANEAAVRELFSAHGAVQSVRLMKDKHTGKRRGFGFVEIAEADAEKVIDALNDTEFQQRTLKVREAKERSTPQ
ncbi:RNA-binding protein [Thalassotalea ponticola]|uniref:RNA recognition motif domain-containing protein n=1 Tax=Thalassotalea ponticola TaxID=1523392 RepID=UPI0025B29F54|nr:RNA-binding protein [Thalassotalea ponticola]MDN3652828.1 RNA-binding protein [Thalassotalea ponticola]